MTTPDQSVPEGGASDEGLAELSRMEEQEYIDSHTRRVAGGFISAQDVLAGMVNAAVGAVESFLRGLIDSLSGRVDEIRDGQLDLNDRTDLLSPLQDYASAYMESHNGINNTGRLRFTKQIGPTVGADVLGDGRIRLLDRGLWDIRMTAKASYTVAVGSGKVSWRINVLRPNGSVFSTQQYSSDQLSTHSVTLITSVVVPDSGYYVEGYCDEIVAGREIRGGAAVSRLTVQHISRSTDFQIEE